VTKGGLAHHPLVEEILALKHTIMEANLQQAQSNLKHETELKTLYDDVKQLQSKLKMKVEQVNQLQRRQMELCKPMDKKKIIQRLKKAKKESFDESEDLAHDWLNSSSPGSNVDEFIDRFLEMRIVHHVRAAKMERLEKSS
jgi:predicted nuclease with TOPRIM domain